MYICQSQTDFTGEHTIILICALEDSSLLTKNWSTTFEFDFKMRFIILLAGAFRCFQPSLAISILGSILKFKHNSIKINVYHLKLDYQIFSDKDFKRLSSYGRGLTDYHVIID